MVVMVVRKVIIVSVHVLYFSFRGLKKFSGGWGVVVVRKVIIVSVHVLYVSFTLIYVGQVRLSGTPVYVELHQFTPVYVGGQGHGARQ